MPDVEFAYDVAFSFLGQDEPVAVALNERLQGRLRTFIYSDPDRQVLLAGRDGEDRFSRVFGAEARTVVVLYRQGWGDRGFTAVEERAIRNRAFDLGYDFVTFIPLDDIPAVPPWLPKNRIWVGLKRWGLDHAATVIESRVQEAGGTPSEESAEHVAARARREIEASNRRAALLETEAGVRGAIEAFEEFTGAMKALQQQHSDLVQRVGHSGPLVEVLGGKWRVTVRFDVMYANTLRGAKLRVAEWKHDAWPFYFAEREPERTTDYGCDIGPNEEYGWRQLEAGAHEFVSPSQLADVVVRLLLDRIRADNARQAL